MNDSETSNLCLNSVHSPAAAVRNSPLSLEGGITVLVNNLIPFIFLSKVPVV